MTDKQTDLAATETRGDLLHDVILGALLHDVGKFMQRAGIPLSKSSHAMDSSICPTGPDGDYTHKHVLWTDMFFDLQSNIAAAPFDLARVRNLATYHHKPATNLQSIIAEANRLSSGERLPDDSADGPRRNRLTRVRLRPILNQVSLPERRRTTEDDVFGFKLGRLRPETAFPDKYEERDLSPGIRGPLERLPPSLECESGSQPTGIPQSSAGNPRAFHMVPAFLYHRYAGHLAL